jgi:hypothetical protein
MCEKWYVLYVLVECQLAISCIYTSLPPDDGQLANLKHVEVQ